MMLTNKLVSDACFCRQDMETVINRQDDSSSGCFKSRNLEGIHCDNQVQRCNIDNNVKVPFDNCLSSHLIQCWGPQYLDEDDEIDNDPLIENKVSKLPVDEALNAQIWQEILEAAEEEPFFLPAHFDVIEMPSANSSSPLVSSESFRHACLMMGLNLISGGFHKVAGWQGISNGSINQSHALSPDFSYNRPLPAHSGYLPFPSMVAGISENQSHRTVGNKDLLGKSFSAEPEDALDKGIAPFHGAQAVQRSWLQTSLGLLNKALTALPFAFLERPLAMFSALTITVLDSPPALAEAEPTAVSFQNGQSQHSNNVTTCQSSPSCREVLHRLGFSSAELLWLADEKFSSDEKQTVAHQLKRLLTESENHRHKRHHKVDSHTNDANLKKILKYLNRHGIPKTPEQHEKYRAFIEEMHLNKLEKATEAALRTTAQFSLSVGNLEYTDRSL